MRSILVALGAAAALAVCGVRGETFYGNTSTTTVSVAEECAPVTTSTIYYTLPLTSVNADVGVQSSLPSDSLTETTKTTQTSFVTVQISSLPVTTTIQTTSTFTTFVTELDSYPVVPGTESYTTVSGTRTSTSTTTVTHYETMPTTTGTTIETTVVAVTPVGSYSFGPSSVGTTPTSETSAITGSEVPGSASSVYTEYTTLVESQSLITYSTTKYITSVPSPSVQSAICSTYVTTEFLTTVYVYTQSLPTPSPGSPTGAPTGSGVVVITSDIIVVPEISGALPSTSGPILESHTITLQTVQTLTQTLVPETTITPPPVTYTSVYNVTETLTPATTLTSLQILETTFPLNPAPSSSAEGLSSTSVSMTTFTVYTTISYTISQCPDTVTRCPYGSVTTETISQYVTTCPADLTSTLSPTAYEYGNATQTLSQSTTASGMPASSREILPTASGWNTSYSASGSVGPIGFSASSVFDPTSLSPTSSGSLLSSQISGGVAASSGFPVPSANSSVMSQNGVLPIQTSGFATSSGFPAPSVNSSVLTIPVSSFSVLPVQTSISAASSSFLVPSANSSVLSQSVVSPIQTSGFATSSGVPAPSVNSSVLTSPISSFSALPVQTSISATSSGFALPSNTSVSLSPLPTTGAFSTVSSLQTTSTAASHHIIPILGSSETSSSSIATSAASLPTANGTSIVSGSSSISATPTSDSATTTSTNPNASSTCGEHGDFTLNFDDVPELSAPSNSSSVTAEPLFSPYHQLYFSENFVLVPLPTEAYNPSSGKRLLEFMVTNSSSTSLDPADGQNLQTTGGIGNGYTETLGCFGFNVYGASLGCASQGPPCVFQIIGMRFNASIQMEQFATSQTIVVPSCPAQKNCALVPTTFDDTFVNLNSIMINATDGTVLKSWFMDDLHLGWTNNTCEAGLCRQNSI